jgi:hypothetical protein
MRPKKKSPQAKKMQSKKKKKARHTQNASENKKHAWTFQLFSFLSERKPKRKKRPLYLGTFPLFSLSHVFSSVKSGEKKTRKMQARKEKKNAGTFQAFFLFLANANRKEKKNDPCYVSFCLSLFHTLFFSRSLFFFSLCCIFVARFLFLSLCTHSFFFARSISLQLATRIGPE